MAVLSTQSIIQLSIDEKNKEEPLIDPFLSYSSYIHGLSLGVSSCGYDVSIAQTIVLYPNTLKYMLLRLFNKKYTSFALASTVEKFSLPNWLCASVKDKSTWARRGLAVQNTFIEPGWRGWLTLELTNHGNDVLRLPKQTPIAQIIFNTLDQPTVAPYNGKYQNQKDGPQQAIGPLPYYEKYMSRT